MLVLVEVALNGLEQQKRNNSDSHSVEVEQVVLDEVALRLVIHRLDVGCDGATFARANLGRGSWGGTRCELRSIPEQTVDLGILAKHALEQHLAR